jgi:hypothetical protein
MSAAEQLLRDALRDAAWQDKRIYPVGGEPFQSWKVEVYLHIPADSGMGPEEALNRELDDGKPSYSELLSALGALLEKGVTQEVETGIGMVPERTLAAEHAADLLARAGATQ